MKDETTRAWRASALRRFASLWGQRRAQGTSPRRRAVRLLLSGAIVLLLCAGVVVCAWRWTARRAGLPAAHERVAAAAAVDEATEDAALERAATAALDGREGTVILLDPQTGRLRAVVNSRLAFEEAWPPGSTIKPFTLLAALRAGVTDEGSRTLCRQKYRRAGFEIRCSHPHLKPPFDPTHALAYSCNYFFSQLGERLDEESFNRTLSSFGFGARTGAGGEAEGSGALPRGVWHVRDALGEGRDVLTTPVQLITAYTALVNGGRLFIPQRAKSEDARPLERALVSVTKEERALLLEGMRGAVAYGTAAPAHLTALPLHVFGKTGTSTPADDFRSTHGWFVGFAARPRAADESAATADGGDVRLAVLVFLKRAHGSECAQLSRPIFEEFARIEARRNAETHIAGERRDGDVRPMGESEAHPRTITALVRLRMVRRDMTLSLPLEEYVFGVLAAEASVESEYEALKAQAVVSRTFAVRNLRRHQRAGYDLCDTTHCQRFRAVRDTSARADFYDLVRSAVTETAGMMLRDPRGKVAESYFSADCGGATANPVALWGASAGSVPAHLRGRRDDYCMSMPRRSWTDTVPARRLHEALGSDPRSDVGSYLDGVRVVRRDASGRVELIALEGETRRLLRGWDFKIIVGRTLGWNVLKSTRFDVRRAGPNFVFRGSGFGHGLGLCQLGAHVMARRGASFRQILDQYLPGTQLASPRTSDDAKSDAMTDAKSVPFVSQTSERESPDVSRWRADKEQGGAGSWEGSEGESHSVDNRDSPAGRVAATRMDGTIAVVSTVAVASEQPLLRTHIFRPALFRTPSSRSAPLLPPEPREQRHRLASENFRASYPARLEKREVEAALRTLDSVRADVASRLSAASIRPVELPALELYVHDSTGAFVAATGQPSWVAAATRGLRIHTQPLGVLRRRRTLINTLRHEYVHAVVEALARGRAPRWLAEGLAVHVAGEAALLLSGRERVPSMTLDEMERRLSQPSSAEEMRALYAAAYREVRALIRREGEASVWRRVARS